VVAGLLAEPVDDPVDEPGQPGGLVDGDNGRLAEHVLELEGLVDAGDEGEGVGVEPGDFLAAAEGGDQVLGRIDVPELDPERAVVLREIGHGGRTPGPASGEGPAIGPDPWAANKRFHLANAKCTADPATDSVGPPEVEKLRYHGVCGPAWRMGVSPHTIFVFSCQTPAFWLVSRRGVPSAELPTGAIMKIRPQPERPGHHIRD